MPDVVDNQGKSAAGELELPERAAERRDALVWLGQMRWWALTGAIAGVVLARFLGWDFVDSTAVLGGVVVMVLVNGLLVVRSRRPAFAVGGDELVLHVAADLLLLTWMLAWAGGVRNPISVSFSFHVVLGALLAGRRGALAAAGFSFLCLATLWTLEETGALPVKALLRPPALLWTLSLGLMITGLAYLSLVVANRNTQARVRAKRQGEETKRSLALLLESLEALRVGLKIKGVDGTVQLQNETARVLSSAPGTLEAERDLERDAAPGVLSRRFAVRESQGTSLRRERIIDLLALSPQNSLRSEADPRGKPPGPAEGQSRSRALLYVDRTDALLVEQRHIMLERLATLGRALQGVAHELNTPLTTMQTLAKDLKAALHEADLDADLRADVNESIDLLVEESRRCRNLTQGLLATASDRQRQGQTPQSALQVARRAVRLVGDVDKHDVFIDEASLDDLMLADGDRVLQVVMNLVQNALRATIDSRGDGGGPRVRVIGKAHADTLVITIADRGPGLPDEVRARLFEPFVTTRAEGTGLGLYTSLLIATELGGSLTLEDGPSGGPGHAGANAGTVATLTLPRRRPGAGEGDAPSGEGDAVGAPAASIAAPATETSPATSDPASGLDPRSTVRSAP